MLVHVEWWHVVVVGIALGCMLALCWYGGKAEANAEWRERVPEIERRAIEINEAENLEPSNVVRHPAIFGGQLGG